MNRNDPQVLMIAEFASKEMDAGEATGVVLHEHGKDELAVHSFYHDGGDNPKLHMFWGHYFRGLDEKALRKYASKIEDLASMGYALYRRPEEEEGVLSALDLTVPQK